MSQVKRWLDEVESRGFGDIDGALCPDHIRDNYLMSVLLQDRVLDQCFLCGTPSDNLVSSEDLLGHMMALLTDGWEQAQSTYVSTWTTMDLFDHYFDDLFDIEDPTEIFERFAAVANHDEWASRAWDELDEDEVYVTPSSGWQTFVGLVQRESRFIFLNAGQANLPSDGHAAARFVADFGRMLSDYESSLVRVMPSGSVVFRGRMVGARRDAAAIATADQLGPSPSKRAAPSRMSPAGISMFYGSEAVETAVTEIAVHDSDQREYAVVGAFRTMRDLRVLDLVDIDIPSVFDQSRAEERVDKRFLQSFADDITRPIRLDGREHREYAPTQILTEVVRWAKQPSLDGIRLPSAQNGKPTLVLFFGHGSAVDLPTADSETVATFGLDANDIEVVRVHRRVDIETRSRIFVGRTSVNGRDG